MKNIIRLILILSVFSFPRLLFGQAMGTYEVRCVRVSSFLIGDEGGLGNPDVTWELSMRFLSQGLGTISQLPEQCFHKDEYAALTEYYPGSWYLSSGLYPAPPCGTKVYSELVMSGFEKDFIPNNCDFDIFDDFGRIATTRTVIGWRVDQPDIWYPYEYIVRSADNQPLYKFKFEYKYSISIMDGPLASSLTVGGQALSNILCEGDVYKIRANTFSGNNGYFEWERQVVGTSTWIPVKKGYGLQEISVQATTPGNKYRVRAIANDGWNCLGDPAWQTSLDPPTVIPRSPQVYEIEAIGFPACGTTPTGSIRMLPYNYTPTGIYNITLVSESNSIAPINQSGVDLLSVVVFNNLPPDYYTIKISRPNGPPDSITGQCTGIREHILVRSTVIPTPQSVTVEQDQQCFGVNDGQIRVVPQSNPSPYFELDSITLIGPVTRVAYAYRDPRVIGGLPPGTYSVVVSRNGCSSSAANVTINSVTSPLTANISSVSPLCAGERGQITVSGISGGTPFPGGEYKILYVGGEITMVSSAIQYNDLYPRPYTIRIFDANNCMLTLNATITPPPAGPMVSLSVTNATSCMPAGQIVAAGSGGVDPYLFSKDGGMTWQASTTFSNLLPGNYTILIQDASMCESSANATITTPNFLSITPNQTMTPCADSATAQISTNQSGGNQSAPYLLELFEQANLTTPIQTMTTSAFLVYWDSLSAGTYVVRVTDMDNCTAESTILVKELPQAYFVNVFDPSPECFDDPLPPIEVEVSGRSQSAPTVTFLEVSIDGGPFQFANATSDNGVTSFHEFTPAMLDGNFIFKDQQGCPVDSLRTFDRTRPDSIGIHIISVDSASCQGVFDGSISCSVIGAVKPFKLELFTVDPGSGDILVAEIASTVEDTFTFSNLGASVGIFFPGDNVWQDGYYLRVTDNLQNPNTTCQAQTSDSPPTNLYAPAELNVNGIAQAQLLDCMGQGGSILAAATGGTAPYEYSLDGVNWQTSTLLSGAVDTNIVFARDVRGCQSVVDSNGAIDTVFIDFAPIPIAINAIYTVQGSECSPQRDSIVLDGIDQGFYVNGFSVSWNTCSGSTIPAANNEKDLINIISIGANYLVVENLIDNIIPAGCDTVVEGTMLFNLIDSNTCNVDIAVPIKVKNRQPRLSVINKIGVTCSGDMDGSVTVRVIDSLFDAGDAGSFKLSPPFEVTLNNGTPQMVTTTPYETTFIGVSESGFTISVSDANSCSTFIIDSIGRLSPYDLTIVNTPVTGCGEDSTGGLSITVNSGSNLPYMWTWYSDAAMTFDPLGPTETLNSGQSSTLTNLPVTTLRAIISDNNACVDTLDFNIQGPNILTLLKTDSTNLTCNNSSDGSVSVNFIGGTTPAQYSIDGLAAQSDSFFTGLSAGLHTVVVMDFNGCNDSVEFNLTQPSAITVDDIVITDVNCFGESTGRIQITASNGVGALEYALNSGAYVSPGDFPGLPAGIYNITVRDANLCTLDTMNIEVTQPPLLSSGIAIADSLSCVQNATLVAAGIGGTLAYNYNWDGGTSLTDTLQNASAGQHIVQITDGLGCMVMDTIILTIPNSPILSLTADTADACNQSNGSLLVMANNGTSPFSYEVNGQNNNTGYFSGLEAAIYDVIVTDNNGCMDTLIVEIDSVEGPQITQIDTIQTTCAGDNGSISLTIANGTIPYQYNWSHDAGLNLGTATGLGVGTYLVTVTDARQCTVTETIEITQTSPPILSVIQEVNSACGQNNGMAIVSSTGGNPAYSFSWSHDNTITGPSASNLAPATYLVIVTDQNACKDSVNVIINEVPAPIISVVDSVNESCDLSNGSITLTATNGTRPFTYTWSHNGGILDSMATNLSTGTYIVTVTDVRNCQDTISVTLDNTPGPSVSLVEFQNNMCPTGNGMIRVTANGGAPGYTYAWSHDNTLTDSLATGLTSGSYTVSVTDQNTCTDTLTQTIIDDNLLNGTVANIEPTGCDTANGSIELSVTGGQMDYTYTWSHNNMLDSNYVDSLSAGVYTITITDMLGCAILGSATVGTATGPTISLLSTDNSYCGPNMGSATLTATGGVLPYTYEWSHNASITDSFATDLPGGGIIVTVRDANNCTSMTSFVIDETTPITLSLANQQDETCEANNGEITVSRMGGTNPITYSWSHNAGLNSSTASNLSSGMYTVTVTDNVGCMDTLTAVVDSIPSPNIQLVSSQNNACSQVNGSIVTMASGGTPGYIYTWSHDATLNSPTATNLTGGTYTVTVTDASLCIDTLTTSISDDAVLTVSEVSVTPTGCGIPDGIIVASVAGGIFPYAYQWSHDAGLTDSIATGLSAGNYTLIASDAGGCLDTISFVVPMTVAPTVSLNSSQPNDCGQSNGQIIVNVSAGSLPYSYAWSHDATLNDSIANNLMEGTYNLTVTDNNGCTDTLEVTLTCLTTLAITVVDTMDETCGQSNGSIAIAVSGGTLPYTYTWSHDATLNAPSAMNLAAGNYTVTVTDGLNAMATFSYEVANIPAPDLTVLSFENNNCPTGGNGSITLAATGGLGPFTYDWNHDSGLSDSIAINLMAGFYTAVITDSNNCSDTISQSIINENLLAAVISEATPTSCAAPSGRIVVTPAQGRPPYSYTWSHDAGLMDSIATNLPADAYTITVTDFSGCVITIDTMIFFVNSPTLSLVSSTPSSCELANGSASVSASGGTPAYTYTWSHDVGLMDTIASTLTEGTYNVTVTDANACIDILTINIGGSPAVDLSLGGMTNETCGLANGSITLTTVGGTAPFNYSWSHDATLNSNVAGGLSAGTYTAIVTDMLGCMDTMTVALTNTEGPQLALLSFEDNACAQSNGTITVSASNGTPGYTYMWSHDNTLNDSVAMGLPASSYTVTVVDGNNCTDTLTQTILDQPFLDFMVLDSQSTSCTANTGSITLAGSGGQYPYQYTWSHNAMLMDSVATDLAAGTYTATITDSRNCQVILTTNISQSNSPALILNTSSNSSCELANGSASVSASGGTPPYLYTWSHDAGLMDSVAVNLAEGTYSVTVTDANACIDILSINIGGSPAVDLSLGGSTDETCGLANGSITLATTGGTSPINYSWSHDATLNSNVASGLIAGTYSTTVTDMLGCIDTISVTISNTDGPQLTLLAVEDNACTQANGTIAVSTSNGTPGYTYMWSHDNTVNDSIAIGLAAGSYTVTVVDGNNCMDTLTQTILDQPFLDFMVLDSQSTSCAANTGSITLAGTGGQYPYQYTWSHDATLMDSVANNLAVGMYTVSITDARNCQVTLTIDIMQSSSPDLTLNTSNNSSCGLDNGSASVSTTSGTSPYTYTWSHDAGLMDSVAMNLPEGIYTVTVTDAAGCSDQLDIMIGGSLAVIIDTTAIVNATCGLANGSITVVTTGGTAPITYTWSHDNTISANMASDLPAGDYVIIGTDNLGCRDTIVVSVSNTAGPVANITAFNDNACAQANGSVTVGFNGGTPPYTYTWSHDMTLMDSVAQGLMAGTYIVIVSDANGCADTISQTIVDAPILGVVVSQIDSSNCDPGTGTISVTASGGTGMYTYAWSHDVTLNSNQANNLMAGAYTVTVTDDLGCMVTLDATVPEFTGPMLSDVIVLPTTCAGATGSIQLVPAGGLPPYSYIWSHDVTLNGPLATNLASGIYEYQVIDARNCTVTDFATIGTSTDIDISLVSAIRPACGMDDGLLEISIVGGAAPYTTQWFNTADLTTVIGTDLIIANLVEGEYLVNVSDADGCTDQNTYTLLDLDAMNVQLSAINVSCFGADDGSVFATVIGGGTAPFTYLWDDTDGSTTSSITPVDAGTYNVTVTDDRGCTFMDGIEVLQPTQLMIDTVVLAPGCDDAMSGSIFVNGSGGNPPYIYLWPVDGVNGQTRSGLVAGNYTLLLIDSTGCQDTFDIAVPDVEDITLTAGDIVIPACDGSVGGSLTVQVDGGQTPYMYVWDDALGQTNQTATNLMPGSYRVTVTDQGGCSDTLSMVVPDQQGLTIMEVDLVQPACNGDQNGEIEVDVAGGSGNYAYLWDDITFQSTVRAVGLGAGRYIVRVTDLDFGCISRDTFFLENPTPIIIDSFQTMDASCFGNTDGQAEVFATGGTGDYSYTWNDANSQIVNPAIGLAKGVYQVTVTDENNCMVSGNIEVMEPDEIAISIMDSAGVSCFGSADGMIKVAVSGGSSPYTIFWPELNITADSVGGLSSILYTIEITDDNGCMATQSVQISEPTAISIELIELINPACNAAQAGQITVNATGGTGVLSYLWDDAFAQITPTAFNLDSGTYSVVVMDERMCSDTMTFMLTGQSELIVDLIDSMPPLCFGDQNGSLNVSVTGGNDDYVYLWNDPAFQTNANAINLAAGAYILFTSNGDGSCPTNDTIILGQPELIVSTEQFVKDVNCFGEASGEIVLDVSGGVMPYQINWSEIGMNLGDSVSMLTAGTYYIEIIDVNACTIFDTVEIQEPMELLLASMQEDPICFGDANGNIVINASGGQSPYAYQWSPPLTDTTSQVNNLSAGLYDVTVTDNNGCMAIQDITLVEQSSEINLTVVESLIPSCSGADNGLLLLSTTGGSGLISYQWSNGINNALNDMLMPNLYVVTITDGLGCAIDTTFDLSQVTDLNLDLGFTDTIICEGQLISIAANSIPGATYVWSGPDGFTSNDSVISVGAGGDYSVSVTVSICSDSETATVTNSGAALLAQFILPTQIVVGDTVVMLERSWPIPENVAWSFDADSVIFVGQNLHQWIYTFPFAGQFEIGLSAEIGSCESFISKTIIVHPDSSSFAVPQSVGEKQILAFSISPNPSVGFFDVDFELAQEKPYYIDIYQINGTSVENRSGLGVGPLVESYTLVSPVNGLYVVSLRSGNEIRYSILSIERP